MRRKKISISKAENDNFRIRVGDLQRCPTSRRLPSRAHQQRLYINTHELMGRKWEGRSGEKRQKCRCRQKLKLVWNLIWSCHHDDNKVLHSTADDSFVQSCGWIFLCLQRIPTTAIATSFPTAIVIVEFEYWNHRCLRRRFHHNDNVIISENGTVCARTATRRCTFSNSIAVSLFISHTHC